MKHLFGWLPLLAPDGDGGGGDGVFKALTEQMIASAAGTKVLSDEVCTLKARVEELGDDNKLTATKIGAEVSLMRGVMSESYGVSGAGDWMNEAGKFMNGVWEARKGVEHVRDERLMKNGMTVRDTVQKAVATFTTTNGSPSNSSAGLLIPEMLRPGIVELSNVYGKVYTLCTRMTLAAGQKIRIPAENAAPVATWRTLQAQAVMPEESTPASWSDNSITTELLGVLQKASNELMGNTSINFGAILLSRALRAMMKKFDVDIMGGTTGSDACPSASIVNSATAQTAITGGITFAKIVAFLQECVADDPSSFDNAGRVLSLHPKDVLTLATATVGTSELTGMLLWGDPRKGIPPTLLGYPLLITPACYGTVSAAAARRILLLDFNNVFVGEDPAYSVDFSEHALFTYNATALRFLNHFDWCTPVTSEMHQASVAD